MTIPAPRRQGGTPIILLVCGILAGLPDDADAKPRRPDLTVGRATISAPPALGARVTMRVTVRNKGKAAAKKSQLSVSLEKTRAPLARARVAKLMRGKQKVVSLTVGFPKIIARGRYRIAVCADAAKKVKERSEANNCRRLPQVLEVTATVPVPPGPVGAPPPAPPGGPVATPTAVPTPTATATATPTSTPVGEVPSEDLPPLIPSLPDTAATLYGNQGVEEGAIAEQRVGILHGRTIEVNGDPLAGVRVAVHDHPELGSTTTGADGAFDLAVNGGAQITLEYTRAGHLEVQRDVDPTQLDWSNPPDVVMLASNPAGVILDPPGAGGWTTARATSQTDPDGTRTSTLLFAPGTTATMRFADGDTEPLPGPWTVRQTEYTSVGPPAMPGDLPPTSGYTYAAELAIDEAEAAGADSVDLTPASPAAHAAVNYVENFIGAPVGTDVPTGAYDRTDATWEPSPDGRVVKVISETGGAADLDTDGDGDSDAGDYPAALKLTAAERTTLAPLFAPGDELFRVPIPHMTPWDHNFPYGYPPGTRRPRLGPDGRPLPNPCNQRGSSTIDCEDQNLREAVPVPGTPYELAYSSDWEPSVGGDRSLDIVLTPPTLPDGLLAVGLQVDVAGQRLSRGYGDPAAFPAGSDLPPITPELVGHVEWNGLDGLGDPVIGSVTAQVTLDYYYRPFYYPSPVDLDASFGQFAEGDAFAGRRGCTSGQGTGELCAFKLSTKGTRVLGSMGRKEVGLGAWDLSAHHVYDAVAQEVRLGDGTTRRGGEVDLGRLRTVADAGEDSIGTTYLGVLPDGSILHGDEQRIMRTPPGEAAVPFAGDDSGDWGMCDGGPALERSILATSSIAVRPDGGVVLAMSNDDELGDRICEVTPDGRLVLIGGAGFVECPDGGDDCRGDGGQAKDAPIHQPDSLTIAPDGSIYFVEEGGATNGNDKLVRRIDPSGIISTIAGGGNTGVDPGDGVPAIGYHIQFEPTTLLAMDDGTVLMTEQQLGMISEIGTDGLVRRYAGTFNTNTPIALDVDRRSARIGQPREIARGRDGSVYVLIDRPLFGNRPAAIIRIRPDGVAVRAVGWGPSQPCPNTPTELESAVDRCGFSNSIGGNLLAVDGAGRLLFFDGNPVRVRRLETSLPTADSEGTAIPSVDGREVWLFDGTGRHLRTVDGLTGSTLVDFGYDAAGRLVRASDGYGHQTVIERNGSGAPTAIVAPDGRRTTLGLNAGGRLNAITDPTGETRGLSYDGGGRLSGQHLPSGRESSYAYNGDGRLISATGGAGQTRTLARTVSADVTRVDVTTGGGRVTRYTTEPTTGGGVRRTVRTPSGSVTELLVESDGTRTLTLPSGETRRTTSTSDKRFGAAVSRIRSQTTTAPSGKSVALDYTYAATLDGSDPFNPVQLTTDVTSPFGVTHHTYTGATRKLKTTTPAGRQETTTLDARGRPVELQVGDPAAPGALAPTLVEYGAHGEVSQLSQAGRVTRYERDASGRVTAMVAPDGARLEYAYDAADRLIERRYPGGRTYHYGRDEDGEPTSRKLPSDRTHTFTPTGLSGETSSWTPPGGAGAYTIARDDDELATSVTSPTGVQRTITVDAAGRATGAALPSVGRTAAYVPDVDRIGRYESTAAPGSEEQGLDAAFDGMRVTKLTADGLSPAETTWTYGANLRHNSTRLVSGGDDETIAYTRDADGVLTGVGPFTHERTGPDHSLSAITDGTGRTEETIDAVADLDTRRLTVGGAERYRLDLTTDASGRVTGRHEVAGASDHSYSYTYDAMGQLTQVRRDGAVVETYAYDLDGDRTSQGATYDAGGKLTSRGGTSYTFDADGFLAARGADTFSYARSGELRSATVGGTSVSYAYDGLGRMVGRVQGGATTRYVYGDPDFGYRVSAARAPNGTLDRYLYGPRGNLYAILRGAERFHVGTDQVGSPRVVVAADGTVVKRLEYDAYGVTTDLDPGFFLPFGYAGGLRDPVTSLVRFGLRDYEPQSGRFTARDPAMFEGSPRSLYGYANNSPVSYHDPGGTASISIGGYLGGGGGATFYFDPGAFLDLDKPLITGLCVEAGLGLGGGVEADVLEQAPTEAGLFAFAEVTPKIPFLGGKLGGEFDLICGRGKLKLGANVGPFQFGGDNGGGTAAGGGVDPSAEHWAEMLSGATEAKLEGKAGFKVCLPPPPR